MGKYVKRDQDAQFDTEMRLGIKDQERKTSAVPADRHHRTYRSDRDTTNTLTIEFVLQGLFL